MHWSWSPRLLKSSLEYFKGRFQDRVLAQVSDEELRRETQQPDAVASFTYGEWRSKPPEDLLAWYAQQRIKARETVSKYIRPSQRIRDKVEVFWRKNVPPGFVLGIHMRGTGLHYAPPVSPAEYFPVIKQWIEKEPDLTLFLATEQTQYYELMRARHGGRLVVYDVARSDDDVAPFNMESVSPYIRSEDVLLDILFLSRCNHLLKGASNIGEMSMYFGPDLQCADLSLGKVKAFDQDYRERWDFHASKPAWALLKGSDLTRLSDNAFSQSWSELLLSWIRQVLFYLVVLPVREARKYRTLLGKRLRGAE